MNKEEGNLFNEDVTEEFDVIVLYDEETNEDVELVIIDSVESDNCTYLLVIESEEFDDDEPSASIIKETKEENGEFVYEVVEDEDEFNRASELFKDNEDFDLI